MAKSILVTGGAGFIGSNFVHYLKNKYPEYRVVVLDCLTYAGSVDNLPEDMLALEHPTLRFWYGDVLNADLVDTLVSEADYVVHFAAETHVTRSIFDNRLFFQTDVLGTQCVANATLKYRDRIKRFLHISTSEVYGTAESRKMDEEHPLKPMSPYASAKCGADRLVYSYWATYGLPVTILRPFNNFGPRQHLEKVVPRFITGALLGEELTVHGNGGASRDFIYVDDTCRAVDLVLHADGNQVDGEVFNVASETDRSVLSIAEDILSLMTPTEAKRIGFTGDRPGQVVRHTGDASKIKSVLGWEPVENWDSGLRKTISWYEDNQEWWKKQVWMRHIPITTAAGVKEFH